MKLSSLYSSVAAAFLATGGALAFIPANHQHKVAFLAGHPPHGGGEAAVAEVEAPVGFIDGELRGAAMRLHTRSQAPREGQAPEPSRPKEKHATSLDDYLHFLVDSRAVYQAFEDAVGDLDDMTLFRDTGLERVKALDEDIVFLCDEYGVAKPEVGEFGKSYAEAS